jgi:carbon storage regulator
VLAVSRDKIRLGITAPREIPVFRKEVYLSIKEEQAEQEEHVGANNSNKRASASKDGVAERVQKALDKLSHD